MEKNKFNFSKLAALFTDYPALKIDEISYSYQQIDALIQKKLTDYSHSSKTVITLINDSPLNFIIDFLAIIESGNYPLVVDKSFKKKSFEFELIPEDTLFSAEPPERLNLWPPLPDTRWHLSCCPPRRSPAGRDGERHPAQPVPGKSVPDSCTAGRRRR